MNTFLEKVHIISTYLTLLSLFIGGTLFFSVEVDEIANLDLFPQGWEMFLLLIAVIVAIIGVMSLVSSIVLSLYRMAERE